MLKLFVQPRITPEFNTVDGPNGQELVHNMDGFVPPPANIIYQPGGHDGWMRNLWSPDPALRTLLYDDPAATEADTDEAIFAACPGLRDWKAGQIREGGQQQLAGLSYPYLDGEQKTFPQQRAEALMMTDGVIYGDTRFLTRMAEARSIASGRAVSVEDEAAVILAKVQEYDQAATIIGVQKGLLDKLYAAATVAGVLAVTW